MRNCRFRGSANAGPGRGSLCTPNVRFRPIADIRPRKLLNGMAEAEYPFKPKSTAKLRVGDFWPVPLKDRSYACGLVLQKAPTGTPSARVSFCGGLLDWKGRTIPAARDLSNRVVLAQGYMHLLAITNYGEVIGNLESTVR